MNMCLFFLQTFVEETTSLPPDVLVGIQTAPAIASEAGTEQTTTIPVFEDVATIIHTFTSSIPVAPGSGSQTEKEPSPVSDGAIEDAGVLTLGNLLKVLVVLGVFGGVFWWLGGVRLVARYLPGQAAGNYAKLNRDDPEK
jgi:hypothetical protein